MRSSNAELVVSLDIGTIQLVRHFVGLLHPYVSYFKVGHSLAVTFGLQNVAQAVYLASSGRSKVFYDGKLNDTPDTVGKTAVRISAMGACMFTVHASAGVAAMRAAVVAGRGAALVCAVTVLSSLDDDDSHLIFGASARAKTLQFAHAAAIAGCDGIVCSPQELEVLNAREEFQNLLKIVPGIRPHWAPSYDQKRVMTPWQAAKAGANFLVIGRPILEPPKPGWTPVDAIRQIQDELASA